jgi:hypothetical protein
MRTICAGAYLRCEFGTAQQALHILWQLRHWTGVNSARPAHMDLADSNDKFRDCLGKLELESEDHAVIGGLCLA